jgi:hypothetical protein
VTKIGCFSIDFGVISPPGGTPGASRARGGAPSRFLYDFKRPGGGLWEPFRALRAPLACLGATLGVTLAPKVGPKV